MDDMPHTIRSCPINAALLDSWRTRLVAEPAPFFLSDALAHQLDPAISCWPRGAWSAAGLALDYIDSYRSYAIAPAATWLARLDQHAFAALDSALRADLLRAQVSVGNGQVYPWDAVAHHLVNIDAATLLAAHTVDTRDARRVVLTSALWHALPTSVQDAWLIDFVAAQQAPYPLVDLAAQLTAPQRALLTARPHLARLANTFATSSGPNCFATVLAALAPASVGSDALVNTWMHAAPFIAALAVAGYTQQIPVDGLAGLDALTDAVLVWHDVEGEPQHACYQLGAGVVINKNAQAWYSPRELTATADVAAYWADEPYTLVAYSQP